jgi:hypothetical protein
MPIITKPSSIEKDVPATFTLDKAVLAALPIVVANSWFSDTANWKKVLINYKSTSDNERIIVQFDATQPSPTSSFLAIAPSKDVFEVSSIYIIDFNYGALSVPASSLDQEEFIVDFSVAPPEYIVWDNLYQGAATNSTGKLYKGAAKDIYSSTDTNARASNQIGPFGGVFEMKFVISRTDSFGVKVGLALNSLSSSNMYLSVAAINGNLTLNNVNGANANFPSSLGTYDINTDFEIRIKVSAGLIEVFKDGLAIGTPQMWLAGYFPDQMFVAAANVSQLSAPSENVNTEVAILKSSTRISA